MTIIAALIAIAGNLLTLFGLIVLLIKVFKKSILWLIACFLLPPFGIIAFSILNIKEVWKPWAYILLGLIITALGLQLSPKLREHLEENYSREKRGHVITFVVD
ncbi:MULTISPECIES: hypothetical protein [unclassified Lentimonas]|uniref:hypothetical protein n=1 Tax=unclassified Lentimonas TaxID=2630993 RepID=UPI00132B92EF|nr:MULTISPECIES: hypothetical protein [unclassified Lentimonas]CAA6677692.1 Unannotated [Lentimonas sp. CC4]CAA6684955.1 Unannotated [Lentimonas sp. CC6]CAA7077931.1 Unannotated [Lentimonas sp. CC4]CAA7169854.1 Unannotated [Lentimonas sp. CC21]CAA7179972.1 Unannotated [Lentimonas sp. CC8]